MKKILLLHGALGSKEQFGELEQMLEGKFNTYSINFSGHGSLKVPEEPFSIEMFAKNVLEWIDNKSTDSIDIFGYSMGGYVAMFIARYYPQKTGRIFTLGTKYLWNEEIAAGEIKTLDPKKIQEKVPGFAKELKSRHAPEDWELVVRKTAEMMINLGKSSALKPEDYPLIANEVMVGIGDGDKMVTLEETAEVCKKLKNGRMIVIPGTPHLLSKVDPGRLAHEICGFFI